MLSSVLGQEIIEQDASVLHPYQHDLFDGDRRKGQGSQKLTIKIVSANKKISQPKILKHTFVNKGFPELKI